MEPAVTAEQSPTVPLPPVRFRPRRARVTAWIAAGVTLLVSVGLALALSGASAAGQAPFETADRFALVGLGLIGAAAWLLLARPQVWADSDGIRVRNVLGAHELPWSLVRAVRFDRNASWASLELHDDDLVSVMAVQAVDREYAVAAVRALRQRHAAWQADPPAGASAGSDDPSAPGPA